MAHWFEGIFEFLFKYRPTEFAKASFAFGAPLSVALLILLVAAIGVPAVMSYAGVRGKSTRRDRFVLGALRVCTLVVLIACLFRPMLLISAAVPQRNYVGVLIDDSRSMRIADRDGKARTDWIEHQFGGRDSVLLKKLREKFIVRLFSFSSGAQRVDSLHDLTFNASETHVGAATGATRHSLLRFAALVVVIASAFGALHLSSRPRRFACSAAGLVIGFGASVAAWLNIFAAAYDDPRIDAQSASAGGALSASRS